MIIDFNHLTRKCSAVARKSFDRSGFSYDTAYCSPQEQRGEMGLGSGEEQKGPVLHEPDGLTAHTALRPDFEVLSENNHYLYLRHSP